MVSKGRKENTYQFCHRPSGSMESQRSQLPLWKLGSILVWIPASGSMESRRSRLPPWGLGSILVWVPDSGAAV